MKNGLFREIKRGALQFDGKRDINGTGGNSHEGSIWQADSDAENVNLGDYF